MKKVITILMCVLLCVGVSFTVLVGCNDVMSSPAISIEVVNPVTEYFQNDTIDYDNLQIKITYEDGTTKQGTLKDLDLEVQARANLEKVGQTYYVVAYGGLTDTVEITVNKVPDLISAFSLPTFYAEYLISSADRAETEVETRADYRITGETYEVGNVNKLIFRPTATAITDTGIVTIDNPQTTVKVYEKLTVDGEYKLVPDTDLEGIVAINDNTYQFTKESAGKYYKVEISLDETAYDVSSMDEEYRTLSFECVVVDGGYNVYDQIGLSVMNDLTSSRWTEIWKCDIDENFNLTAREDSLKLEADDKPLCEYVGNIDWVILHTSFELDADLLPSYFFWTEETEGYKTAYDALAGVQGFQDKLIGSLRDGIGNNVQFKIMNLKDGQAPQIGIYVNMQKAFFSSSKVSVSANYNDITTPKTASKGGRNLFSVLDYEPAKNRANPTPHWQVFQMYQSVKEGEQVKFTIKNIALSGNTAQQDTEDLVPAGLNMLNCFGNDVNINNVICNSFYTNVTCDSYGSTGFNANSIKFYNSYSNMFYLWRATVDIKNSELIGSGGPLFILCDGTSTAKPTSDVGGPSITVDTKSRLEAYATGNESWYRLYNAQALINAITGQMDAGILNNVYKTVRFVKDSNGNMVPYTNGATGLQYVNVIAAMICEPNDLFTGSNSGLVYVRGTYKTVDENGNVVEQFNVQNNYVQTLTAAQGGNAVNFPPIFQTGELKMFTDMTSLYTLGATGKQPFNPATDGVSWATDTHDKLAVYMSAGSMSQASNAPYFAAILGSAQYILA